MELILASGTPKSFRFLRKSCLSTVKRGRVSDTGSPSTSQGSIVTTISSGTTDTFDGRSSSTYKR
jgi:hypothetical protein